METIDAYPRPYLADAVGVVTGVRANDYLVEDRSMIDVRVAPNDAPIFEAAFTETVWLTDHRVRVDDIDYDGVIPYYAMYRDASAGHGDTQREWTVRKWIRHIERFGSERVAWPNHQSLFLAMRHEANGLYGVTSVGDGVNDSWLFLETIGSTAIAREALVHELAHQWSVNNRYFSANVSGPTPLGHCDTAFGCVSGRQQPFCNAGPGGVGLYMFRRYGDFCLMTSTFYSDPNNGNGEVGFHYVVLPNGEADSEWLRIRRRSDPIPQVENLYPRDPQ